MECGGCRCLLFCLILIAFTVLSPQACADISAGTITSVYFRQNDTPYHDTMKYTVTCYHDSRAFFSYSATCPDFGCTVYEPYYRINSGGNNFLTLDYCDLSGETRGKVFTIHNFSDKPYTRCTWLPRYYAPPMEKPRTWNFGTEEYLACCGNRSNRVRIPHQVYATCNPENEEGCSIPLLPGNRSLRLVSSFETLKNGTTMDLSRYIRYLEACDPMIDPDCPGAVIDGTPLKKMSEYRPFLNHNVTEEDPCLSFLILANPSLYIPEHPCNRDDCGQRMAEAVCELRATIPTDDQMTVNVTVSDASHYVPESPVESLYCSIVQFLGGRCE
jgi:hypothetical protein